jgi:nucleoid-associated protein YgaU
VVENGEEVYEIARRTLGNGDRWMDLFKLNPQFRPGQVIPVGTVLRLPPDAKVPVDRRQ